MTRAGRHLAGLGVLTMAISVVWGCAATEPKTGTNTNWLLSCDSDGVCGERGSCLCGICTTTCDATEACGDIGSGTCAPALATTAQCGGPMAQSVCLAACTADTDCRDALRCIAGTCVQVTTPGECGSSANELACATFDDSALDGWTPVVGAEATLDVVATPAFEGDGALRSQWPAQAVAEQSFAPFESGTLYGRFWIRFDTETARAHTAQLDGDNGEAAFRLVTEGTRGWVETTTGVVQGETTELTPSLWHCIRFSVELSDTQGALQVWLDESRFVDAQGLDTLPEAGVTGFQVGVGWANANTTAYLDYALLSTEPVECL